VVVAVILVLVLHQRHKNKDLLVMSKPYLPKLKGFVNTNATWEAFLDLLDAEIAQQHKNLEQAVDVREIGKAQGAVAALRRLKHLKDEVNVER
jgi:hypothetical protein